jgi:hypothetical protein
MSSTEAESVTVKPDSRSIESHVQAIHILATECGVAGKLILASYGEKPFTGEKNGKPHGTPVKSIVRHYLPGEVRKMTQDIITLSQHDHRNLYIPLALMRENLPAGKKGAESDISAVLGFVLDFDDEQAQKWHERCPVQPDCVLQTSDGRFQAFLFLDRQLPPSDAKQMAVLLCKYARCDHGTKDLTHVWRIPGTLNWPNTKKIVEGGRSPHPQLVSVEVARNGSRTSVEELSKVLLASQGHPMPSTSETIAGLRSTNTPAPGTVLNREIKIGDIILRPDAEPPTELFTAMMELDPKFKATWNFERDDLQDQTQSGHDLALATLAALGGWKAQEIADLIIAFRGKTGNQPEKALREDYMLTGQYALIPKAMKDAQEHKNNPARELVDQAISQNKPGLLFDNVENLARLSKAKYAKMRAEIKEHFGNKLTLGLFDKAVDEARLEIERNKVQRSEVPAVQINLRQHREVVDDACSALEGENSKRPEVFYRSGEVVTVTTDERDRVVIVPVGEARMRLVISRCADFVSETQSGFSPVVPPKDVIHSILANKGLKLPALKYVTTTPILVKNGRIIDKAGYDASSGVYLCPTDGIPSIPLKPSKEDAVRAAKFLADELFHDIPFEDRGEVEKRTENNYWSASLANLMGLLITPVVRLLVKRVPIAVITAPTGGHAKTLITQIISVTSTGKIPGMMGLSPNCKDEEVEKLVASSLRAGNQFTVFDNIEGRLRSPALCRAVTAEVFSARLLGTNTTLELPVNTTWCVTGNNLVLAGDLPRRAYWIRLNARISNPHMREGFKHEDLEGWVNSNRESLVSALLTMVKAWTSAGMPSASGKPPKFGGFESWVTIVGGILDFCGVKGFLGNLVQNLKDDEAEEWEEFLSVWFDEYQFYKNGKPLPVTVNELIEAIHDDTMYALKRVLPLSIADYFDNPTKGFRRRVGLVLKAKEEARFGKRPLYLKRIPDVDSRTKAAGWVVMEG